jgi:hypothetical protein
VMEKHGLKGVAMHMSELHGSRKAPWGRLRRNAAKYGSLLDGLADVIVNHELTPFVAVTLLDEYKALDAAGLKRWPSPYKLTFETVFGALEDTCDPAPYGKIHVVVDQGNCEEWAKQAYATLRAKSAACAAHFADELVIGSRRMAEICGADMIAWELRRATLSHLTKDTDTLRPSFQKVMNGLNVLWKVDFSSVLDTKQLVTFHGSKQSAKDVPGNILLAFDEPV